MGAGVATVGRRKYAVGLYWQPSPSGRVAQSAKEAAKQPGQYADLFSVRPGVKGGRIAQFGLGQSQAGHKMGMASLATTMANRQPGSWAGAFKVNEGIVVIVVRDDLIAPDGDQIFLDDAAARDRLIQEFTLGGLQRIYAPEAWAISGAETIALPFIVQNRGEGMLQPVTIPRQVIIGAASLLLAGLLVVAGMWYYQGVKEEEERVRQEQIRAQAAAIGARNAANGVGKIVYPPPIRYWEQEPPIFDVVAGCRTALNKIPQAMLGWNVSSLSCNKSAASLAWSREAGYTKMLDDATIDASGTTATRSVPQEPELKNRAKEDLLDPNEVTKLFLVQNWNGTISRLPDDPPPPCPPNVPKEDWHPPPPPWIKRGFNVVLTDLPGELPQYFTGIPGVIVNNIVSQSGTWRVEGVIYENRR
jgi:hypothetical protein